MEFYRRIFLLLQLLLSLLALLQPVRLFLPLCHHPVKTRPTTSVKIGGLWHCRVAALLQRLCCSLSQPSWGAAQWKQRESPGRKTTAHSRLAWVNVFTFVRNPKVPSRSRVVSVCQSVSKSAQRPRSSSLRPGSHESKMGCCGRTTRCIHHYYSEGGPGAIVV